VFLEVSQEGGAEEERHSPCRALRCDETGAAKLKCRDKREVGISGGKAGFGVAGSGLL